MSIKILKIFKNCLQLSIKKTAITISYDIQRKTTAPDLLGRFYLWSPPFHNFCVKLIFWIIKFYLYDVTGSALG